jgi:ligand-binding sensor domain-containing protein
LKSSSFFRNPTKRFHCGWLVAAIAVLCLTSPVSALNPTKSMSQYVHDTWGPERGFAGGAVFAICQSKDGYLWIGTEKGLVRFDGSDFTLMQRPIPGSPQIGAVRGLVADSEGNLWIRLDGPHLLRYRDGKFEDAMVHFGLQEYTFTSMSVGKGGELLLWGPQNKLLRFHRGGFTATGVAQNVRNMVIAVAETRDQKIWMGTRGAGLYEIDKDRIVNTSSKLALTTVNALLPVDGGGLLIGTDSGLQFWNGHQLADPGSFAPLNRLQVLALIRDRQGNVWAGSNNGLMRIAPSTTVSAELDNTKQDVVSAVYEDREGNIWFGGNRGIQRLRDGMFTGYSMAQGLPTVNNGPIYVDDAGRTWFAPSSGGLYWLQDGKVSKVTAASLDQDVVYSISGGGGEIWVGRQHGGLTRLTMKGGAVISQTYTEAEGLAQNSIYSVHRNHDGSVWAATVSNGISRMSNGSFTNYSVVNGLASNAVFSMIEASDGTMWFATPSGLESLANGRWRNYATAQGLPSSNVRSIYEDSHHVLWIATTAGLAYLASGHVDVPRSLTNSLRDEILGIAEDKQGSLWIVTSDHVLQVTRDRLLDGSITESDVQSYGSEDGLPGVEGVRRDRSVVTAQDGRIWISLARGLGMADTAAAARNAVPLQVRIESLLARGRPIDFEDFPRLAADTRSVTFNYASSDLDMPQRVKFRYRLDGSDRDWSDDVALRQVVYTNLGPGTYCFRIKASNSIGPWNGPETKINFFVQPAFWQTWWFRVFCIAILFVLVFLIIRLRMAQLTRRLNVRFQDRLAERTLIAQELHDTLLQGFLSASMQLDVVEDQTPHDAPTKPMIKRILQLMGQVTEEGRGALRGLRVPMNNSANLEVALSRVQDEFALDGKVRYTVVSQGESRPLQPMIRDEVYRIGREAVTNAFLHAKADNIEVEVEYAGGFFRVLVRDDGCGIDPQVLKAGREGHWGLPGMHERSRNIGATLRLRSRTGAGTEVELTIPAVIAFDGHPRTSWSQWRFWLTREKFDTHVNTIGKENKR